MLTESEIVLFTLSLVALPVIATVALWWWMK